MLRVLVVLPLYGGSLPVGRYCAAALRDIGCLVDVFEAPDFFPAFSALQNLRVDTTRLDYLENSFLQVISQAILAKVEAFEPDLVLCLAQAPLGRQALARLRADKVATAMWFVEDYRLFPYWRSYAPCYDLFAIIQKEPFFSELAALGVANSLYLPLGALPQVHRLLQLAEAEQREFGSDLSFMGAGYPNRRKLFSQLADRDFKIWGTGWDDEPALAGLVQRGGARINSEDTVRIFNAAAINLNLHSSVVRDETVGRGDFVNPRTFEIAACGGFQVVDSRSLMPELFAPDELVRFDNAANMLAKIDYFLERPEERAAWATRARKRVLRDHTYQARMRALLTFAAERIPGFAQKSDRADDWREEIPTHLRDEIEALLISLNIPPEAPFADVVAAVRMRTGTLNPLETAILFVDEWRKHYNR